MTFPLHKGERIGLQTLRISPCFHVESQQQVQSTERLRVLTLTLITHQTFSQNATWLPCECNERSSLGWKQTQLAPFVTPPLHAVLTCKRKERGVMGELVEAGNQGGPGRCEGCSWSLTQAALPFIRLHHRHTSHLISMLFFSLSFF